jgi:hypothetical protein
MMSDNQSDRDEVADAIRARQSLEGDADPGDVLTGHPFTTGERLGALGDFEKTDADEALDDDDVELSGDD